MNIATWITRCCSCLQAAALVAACCLGPGCSKAVEQKNTANPFKTGVRQAQPPAQPVDDAPPRQEYTSSDYERLGDLSFRGGNLESAFVNYEKALKLSPRDLGLRCKRAWVLVAGGFNSDAATEFEAILAKKEGNASAREGLGQACFQMKNYERAAEEFSQALDLDEGRWRCRNYLGIICDIKGQPRQAIEHFKAAIALRPGSGVLYNNLGIAYAMAGANDEAAAAYRKGLELGAPREKALNNLGVTLAKMGKPEEARAVFRQAGGEARANNNIGCVYLAQGDYDSASKSFDAARRSAAGQ